MEERMMEMSPVPRKRVLAYLTAKKHPLIYARNMGMSKKLRGRVHFFLIFVNDAKSVWTEAAKAQYRANFERGLNYLRSVSAQGIPLFSYQYTEFNGNFEKYDIGAAARENVSTQLAINTDLLVLHKLAELLEKQHLQPLSTPLSWETIFSYSNVIYNCDETAVVLALNYDGRSYAIPMNPIQAVPEYCITFASYQYAAQIPSIVIDHEILHLFGAADLYTPQNVATLAKQYFPNSIMDTGHILDELTRYVIGWLYELSSAALDFLLKTTP